MDCNFAQPRKIFHLDNLPPINHQSPADFFNKKWTAIEPTVTALLLETQKTPSIVLMTRAIQSLLIRGQFTELQDSLIRTFYRSYKGVVETAGGQSNSLLYILAYYTNKKSHYRILFDVLNNYMGSYSPDKVTIEEKAYKILCQEIVNSPIAEQVGQELNSIIEQFRNTQEHSQILYLEYQLTIIDLLGIYRYYDGDFLEKSKYFFVKAAHSMNKNEAIFSTIDQALKRQSTLNKILKPSENTITYIQKEYIEEYYPFLIEFMDYLIQQNKTEQLTLLWQFTRRLGAEELSLLQSRLRDIIKDIVDYLHPESNIAKVLLFRDKITNIITNCFQHHKPTLYLLTNTIEEVLHTNQAKYSRALTIKIFDDETKDHHETIHQLFKLIPNKENFMKQFENYFFKWILKHPDPNLLYQQGIILMMKKECGAGLCRKVDRMLLDVWRDGHPVVHTNRQGNFHCRMLSANDWPKFKHHNIILPDTLSNIILEFEQQLKAKPQYASRELQWVTSLGTIRLSIHGIESIFSQLEASLILILDKSFRPMRGDQLTQILQAKLGDVEQALGLLSSHGILEMNEMNNTYEVNDSNKSSYTYTRRERQQIEESKAIDVKDNGIIIDAAIVKILKRKKAMPKTELGNQIMIMLEKRPPKIEQINASLERLEKRQFVDIDKGKGIIRYRE